MTRVYSIDHDQNHSATLETELNEYSFQCDDTGKEAIEKIEAFRPDIIFLDLKTPTVDGFEVCRAIRKHAQLKSIPVLFISASDNLTDKVQSLEAGADDFITKPIQPDLLRAKVRLLTHTHSQLVTIETDRKNAHHIAMEAMRGSSELGQAIQYIERCQTFVSEHQLGEELLELCKQFGLNAVVGIKSDHGWIFSKYKELVSPLEQEVIASAYDQGRFVDFGMRTQINYSRVALLVKNMPIHEPERYGRIKDILPPILSAMDVRLDGLAETQAILKQTQLVSRSVETVQPTLDRLSNRIDELTKANKSTISDLLIDMSMRLPGMSLEHDQEEFIMTTLEQASELADALKQEGEMVKQTMDKISEVLAKLLQRQGKIAAIVKRKLDAEYNDKDKNFSNDIDLF